MTAQTIQPHNLRAAAIWDSGGADYDQISQTIADAILHCVIRLAPQHGEHILDVGTGTGRAACLIAARGAQVTGIDLGSELITAAKARAAAERLNIDFQIGDAESLPFENKSFDAIISTFGVMFATNPETAAAELARVCKPGGRLGLTTWMPDGSAAGMFKVIERYKPAPAIPLPSPFEWGDKGRLQQLLGSHFDLRFETGISMLREQSGQAVWDMFARGFGPLKTLVSTLEPGFADKLKQEFVAYHDGVRTELGVAMPREYLVTIGVRK